MACVSSSVLGVGCWCCFCRVLGSSPVCFCLLWPVHGVAARADLIVCLSAEVMCVCSCCAPSASLRNFRSGYRLERLAMSWASFSGTWQPRGERGQAWGSRQAPLSGPKSSRRAPAFSGLFGPLLPGHWVSSEAWHSRLPHSWPRVAAFQTDGASVPKATRASPGSRSLPTSSWLLGPRPALPFPRMLP